MAVHHDVGHKLCPVLDRHIGTDGAIRPNADADAQFGSARHDGGRMDVRDGRP
jgi:hypothetical protein